MPFRFPILLLAVLFLSSFDTDPIERLNVKGPLSFNNTSFSLAWTSKPNETYYIQEYLPTGESLEKFNQMLTIYVLDKNIKAEDAVSQKIRELDNRKKTDTVCNYTVIESPDGKEFIVDFILSENRNDKLNTIEFNIYRYKLVELGHKKKGILLYAYSKRAYGDDITPFFNSLAKSRVNLINEIANSELPTIQIIN